MSTINQSHPVKFPPLLSPDCIETLRDLAVDWALSHGLVIRALGNSEPTSLLPHSVVHAPLALFPSPFPRHAFNHARSLQPLFNVLVHSVAKDVSFLTEAMKCVDEVDPFTSRLFAIFQDRVTSGLQEQSISLGIYRSDYLLHHDSTSQLSLQQVELNTIACSFACLSSLTTRLHKYLSEKTDYYNKRDVESTFDITSESIPLNPAMEEITQAIATAHQLYRVPESVVVFVVQPNERNAIDQRWIEYQLIDGFGIKIFRRTLAELYHKSVLDTHKKLFIDTLNGQKEVSVVYYRAGYGPGDYPTDAEWSARSRIESSIAIKCPTVAQQLAGTKKVQQILALPGQLERFLTPSDAEKLRSCFTGLYALDAGTPHGDAAYKMALTEPHHFVVKPQREGGGNNVYTVDIPNFLESLPSKERSAYILMELIKTPSMRNFLVRQSAIMKDVDVISELGIYGVWVAKGDDIIVNKSAGHLLRTKVASSNEGGVAAGFAVLDSPLLY